MLVITKLCRAIYLSLGLLLKSLEYLIFRTKTLWFNLLGDKQVNVVANSSTHHGLVPMLLSIYRVEFARVF